VVKLEGGAICGDSTCDVIAAHRIVLGLLNVGEGGGARTVCWSCKRCGLGTLGNSGLKIKGGEGFAGDVALLEPTQCDFRVH
jgi:hypothetical protein